MSDMNDDIRRMIEEWKIRDVLQRYCRAADRFDIEGMRAVYHEGAVDNHGMYSGPADGMVDYVEQYAPLDGPLKMTQHNLGNIIIDLDGDTALVESYCLVYQGYEDENGAFDELVGCRSIDRMEKRDGKWGIVDRRIAWDWSQIQPAKERFWERFEDKGFLIGSRGPDDPLYDSLS